MIKRIACFDVNPEILRVCMCGESGISVSDCIIPSPSARLLWRSVGMHGRSGRPLAVRVGKTDQLVWFTQENFVYYSKNQKKVCM